ncbi:MAG: putative toxin-antitoxin system toxin component, PIN family [Acidobacteriia bacterium]|nr:putative toxin-antitoxin system toxin component, PIN family [Terriglobia bacterium]
MIRVVLDTNIVVSAMLRAGGLPEAVFNLAIDGVIQLCVSEPILAEYEEVLGRARLAIPPEKVAHALARIREKSSLVTDIVRVDPAACPDDPDDLIFLECAETAGADYLVTGNRKHYPDEWKKTKIVTVRQFWETVADLQTDDPA